MKTKFFLITTGLMATFFFVTACGNNKAGNVREVAQNSSTIPQDETKPSNTFPWDFPEGIALENPEMGQYVLSPYTFYPKKMVEKDNPGKETYIFYSARLNKYGESHSTVGEVEMPNSLIIPLPKVKKAKEGDVLLTWWQSGSGLKRAIVTDASDPEAPKVDYLDLDYSDDPANPLIGNKHSNEQIKPATFDVIEDGQWQSGAPIAALEGSSWKEAILIHTAADKVLALGFAGKIMVYERSACKLIPLRQNIQVGDNVMAVFVGSFSEGYKVTRIDRKIGRVWVEKDGKQRIVSILQVVKSL